MSKRGETVETEIEIAAEIDADLLALTDRVFSHSKSELLVEGRQRARQLLESTRDSKLTVRFYIGLALILSSLVSMRLRNGSLIAHRYCEMIIGPMRLVCSTPWKDDLPTPNGDEQVDG